MAPDENPPSLDEFDAKMRQLRGETGSRDREQQGKAGQRAAFGGGLQAGVELFAGVGGGVLIGYGLDVWLGTRPVLLIVFFVLGSIAGMMNAYRVMRRLGAEGADDPGR
jgi:ATP synthase protein I